MSNDELTNTAVSSQPQEKRHSFLTTIFIRLIKEKPLGTFGGAIVLFMLLLGLFSNFIAPYSYDYANPSDSLMAPSTTYLLGTDNIGRDELSRIIYGARISMIVGLSCASLSLFVAVLIGVPSAYFGGKFDIVVQRFVDAWMCLPGLMITLVIMTMVGPGMIKVILVIGILSGIRGSRVIRSAVLAIKENVYVSAGKAVGCSTLRMLTHHILPNITAPMIVIFTLQVGSGILQEATISFMGYGIPPPTPSWGGMLSSAGRQYMFQAPWLAICPGAALTLVVFGINMVGDALRDLFDPRLIGGVGRYGLGIKTIKIKKN